MNTHRGAVSMKIRRPIREDIRRKKMLAPPRALTLASGKPPRGSKVRTSDRAPRRKARMRIATLTLGQTRHRARLTFRIPRSIPLQAAARGRSSPSPPRSPSPPTPPRADSTDPARCSSPQPSRTSAWASARGKPGRVSFADSPPSPTSNGRRARLTNRNTTRGADTASSSRRRRWALPRVPSRASPSRSRGADADAEAEEAKAEAEADVALDPPRTSGCAPRTTWNPRRSEGYERHDARATERRTQTHDDGRVTKRSTGIGYHDAYVQ